MTAIASASCAAAPSREECPPTCLRGEWMNPTPPKNELQLTCRGGGLPQPLLQRLHHMPRGPRRRSGAAAARGSTAPIVPPTGSDVTRCSRNRSCARSQSRQMRLVQSRSSPWKCLVEVPRKSSRKHAICGWFNSSQVSMPVSRQLSRKCLPEAHHLRPRNHVCAAATVLCSV